MITFPESTLVGKTVPKTAFYKNLEVNARMKQRFVDDVASVTWVAKIAPSTLNVTDGKTVHEITVFRMVLTIDGSTMDAVFSSFVHQIAEGQLNANTKDLHTAVMENKEREQLQKSINSLEQQILKEKQPKKRFELHQKLVKLKAKLNK